MKNLSLLLIFASLTSTAQEVGSVGRWLENENRRNIATDCPMNTNLSYCWEMTYEAGYAEVFIRIPEMGRFTINLGDQEISNSNGMFRFFDVRSQTQELSIWQGRRLIYRVTISPRNNTRLVLDFFSQQGLYLLEEINLNNVSEVYYGTRWNDVWNNYYGRNTMNRSDFEPFFQMFKQQSFDDGKLKFFRIQKNVSAFTTEQIALMMECLSFDSNRLILAKEAFPYVTDIRNYYKLHNKFSFRSTADDFADFLEKSNRR